jgi:hypothetical protein
MMSNNTDKFYVRGPNGMFLADWPERPKIGVKWVRMLEDARSFDWWTEADLFKHKLIHASQGNVNLDNVHVVDRIGDIWAYGRAKNALKFSKADTELKEASKSAGAEGKVKGSHQRHKNPFAKKERHDA